MPAAVNAAVALTKVRLVATAMAMTTEGATSPARAAMADIAAAAAALAGAASDGAGAESAGAAAGTFASTADNCVITPPPTLPSMRSSLSPASPSLPPWELVLLAPPVLTGIEWWRRKPKPGTKKTVALTGQLVRIEGNPAVGIEVQLLQAGGATRKTTTDGQGSFRFTGLHAGAYSVRIDAPGFHHVDEAVTINDESVDP
jgi:hypothetical protein